VRLFQYIFIFDLTLTKITGRPQKLVKNI